MPGKRWTTEEETAWRLFFKAGGPMPEGRELRCAIRHIEPKPIADLADPQLAHATSMAAMRHLSRVPHRHDGDPIRFIEHVQAIAVSPWLESGKPSGWPADVLADAVRDARQCLLEPARG